MPKATRTISDLRIERMEIMLGMLGTVTREDALRASLPGAETGIVVWSRELSLMLALSVERATFTQGPHMLFRLHFGVTEPREQTGSDTVESVMAGLSRVVGDEPEFSLVRTQCRGNVSPTMKPQQPPIRRGKARLVPVGVRYRVEPPDGDVQEVEWATLSSDGETEFSLRYGMVDRWQDPQPWKSELMRARNLLDQWFS